MTIVTTISRRTVIGNMRMITGRSVLSGTTNTGDVATGLNRVEAFFLTEEGSTAKAVSVDETLPLEGGDVTIVSEDNDATVSWMAIGR